MAIRLNGNNKTANRTNLVTAPLQNNKASAYTIRSKHMSKGEFEVVNVDITTRKTQVHNLTSKELQESYELITELITTANNSIKETKTQNFDVADLSWATQPIIAILAKYPSSKYDFITDSISDFLEYCELIKKDYDSKHKLIKKLTNFRNTLVSLSKEYKKHNITTKSTPIFIKLITSFIHLITSYIKKEMLFQAIANHNNTRAEKLIKELDCNIEKNGVSLLFHALHHRNIEIIYKLIEHGTNINLLNKNGDSALAVALTYKNKKNVNIAKILIDNGANVNTTNKSGLTPLLLALTYQEEDIAKKLIENNADTNITAGKLYPLLIAARRKFTTVQEMIEKRQRTTESKFNPIMTAAITNCIPLIESYLNTGLYNIDDKNENGDTALILALQFKNEDIARFLISKGADTTIKNNKGEDAISVAQHSGLISLSAKMAEVKKKAPIKQHNNKQK